MVKFLNKILNAGIDKKTDHDDATRLKGMNLGLLVGFVILLASIGIGSDSRPFVWHLLFLTIVLVASFALNFARNLRLSRYVAIGGISVWLVETCLTFGKDLGLDNYFYVSLVAILLFEKKQKWRLLNTAFIILGMAAVKLYQGTFPPLYALPRYSNIFYLINLLLPSIIIAILSWNKHKNTSEYQANILNDSEGLRNSNLIKDKLLSIVGHDLRAPLNNLKSTIQLIKEQGLTQEELGFMISELEEKLEVSEQLANSLLDWSYKNYASTATEIETNKTAIELSSVCSQILDSYSDTAQGKNIRLQNKVDDGITVLADEDKLLFVLRNLIGNALKYSRNDGTGIVTVFSAVSGNQVVVSIEDNGIGIAQNRVDRLFDLNARRSTEGTSNEKGTGLGLIFCREFVQQHGGNLSVASMEGKGSVFHFTIPYSLN